jgi:hypothetical protein
MPRTENDQQVGESSSSALPTLSNISKSQIIAAPTEATNAHMEAQDLTSANTQQREELKIQKAPLSAIEQQQQYNRDNFAANDRTIQSSKISITTPKEDNEIIRGKTEKLSKNNFGYTMEGNQIIGNKELRKEILYAIEKYKILRHHTKDDEIFYSVGKYHISVKNMDLILHHQSKKVQDKIKLAAKTEVIAYGEAEETDPWVQKDDWDYIDDIEIQPSEELLRKKAAEFYKDEKDYQTQNKKSKKSKKNSKDNTNKVSKIDSNTKNIAIASQEDQPQKGTTQVEIHNITMLGPQGNIEL